MTRRARTAALVAALLLPALSACGDSGDTGRERAVAALKAEMVGNAAMTTGRQLDDEQTTCVASGAVDTLGVDTLQSYELLTDDLRPGRPIEGVTLLPEDANALAEVFADCLDVEQLMEREIISRLDMKAARKRVATRCVRRIVAADDVVRTLSLEFQSADNPVFQELVGQLKSCLR